MTFEKLMQFGYSH